MPLRKKEKKFNFLFILLPIKIKKISYYLYNLSSYGHITKKCQNLAILRLKNILRVPLDNIHDVFIFEQGSKFRIPFKIFCESFKRRGKMERKRGERGRKEGEK